MRAFPILIMFIFFLSLIPSQALALDPLDAVKQSVSGGLDDWVTHQADNMISDNSTDKSDANIFSSSIHPVDVYNTTTIKKAADNSLFIFQFLVYFFLFVTTLFVLLQVVNPDVAASITTVTNGHATYYTPKDIFLFFIYNAVWFMVAPSILLAKIVLCNIILGNMDTSVLNQVIVSSDNLVQYYILAVCAQGMRYYASIRLILIFYSVVIWYLIGVIFAVKKTRWFAAMYILYISVQIFAQVLIVSILTNVIQIVLAGDMGFLVNTLVYGGMAILILGICIIALTLPIWLTLFRPNTMKMIIHYARYAL